MEPWPAVFFKSAVYSTRSRARAVSEVQQVTVRVKCKQTKERNRERIELGRVYLHLCVCYRLVHPFRNNTTMLTNFKPSSITV